MNKWNLVSAIVFGGLCTVLLGAPGEPNPALKSVAHDGTLTGDGTSAMPLGVAGGEISSGVRVVDSADRLVGPAIYGDEWILLRTKGLIFMVSVSPAGFQTPQTTLTFFHATPDCSGVQYLGVGSGFRRSSQNNTTKLFHAAEPFERITVRAYEHTDLVDPSRRISCEPLGPSSFSTLVGSPTNLQFSALGFVPPFRLEF